MYLQPELASRSAYHPQAQTHGEEDEAPCEEEEQIKTREWQRALATTASDCALHSSAFTKPGGRLLRKGDRSPRKEPNR